MNSLNKISNKFSEFINHIKEIIDNKYLSNLINMADDEKLDRIQKFNDSIKSETNFNYLLKKKIKLFSHKSPDTLLISESLFGIELPLKKIFNNQDDTIKLVIWNDLHELLFYYNEYQLHNNLNDNKAQNRLNKLNLHINPIKENLNKILNAENLNETTNNMINDIFDIFQNSDNLKSGNPLNNILELSKTISEKYKDNIENGDIKIDDLLQNISKLPGMESLPSMVDKISASVMNQAPKETVIIDENYSTANVDVGKEETNMLSSMNIGSLLNTMDSMGGSKQPDGFDLNNMMQLLNGNDGIKNLMNSLNNGSGDNIDMSKLSSEIFSMLKK
jgi:hypothetical protein